MWTLSIEPRRDTGLTAVDVLIHAQPQASVADLAAALGRHMAPHRPGLLVVPVRDGVVWPAAQPLAESGLRNGDLLEVVTVPAAWADEPGEPVRRRAILTVVAGPDAGLHIGLTSDSATLGRGAASTLILSDPLVSRRHARILLSPRPMLYDEGSAHGTTAGDVVVTRPTPIDFGTRIGMGDTIVVLEPGESDQAGADTGVLRPPRFGEAPVVDVIEAPAPPAKPKPPPPPWLMMLMPLLLGAAMLTVYRNMYTMIYLLGFPVLMFGGWLMQRHLGRKEYRAQLKQWRADMRELLDRLDRHADAQRERAVEDHPDGPELLSRVPVRHRMLWNRRPSDMDFLACRVGLGPVPALLTAKLRDGGERETRAEAGAVLARRGLLAGLPVTVPVAQARVIAVVGPRDAVDDAVRALLLRLCCDHSPAELSVAGVLGIGRTAQESWLRWLPHTRRRVGDLAPVAIGAVDGQVLLDRLATEDSRDRTVCLVDAWAGVSRRQIEAVAQAAGDRLCLIWQGEDRDTVPAATDVLLDLTGSVPAPLAEAAAHAAGIDDGAVAVIARRDRRGVDRLTTVDSMPLAEAWQAARAMTGYTDEVALLPPETALPAVVRLPEVVGLQDPDSVGEVLERWQARKGLRAPIGVGVDGVITVDLRDDGPHGLVAGTTGSGKSELLQTLICSLALSNPPDRISFLLVDYKGGAAFRECADLPHTVGYITDLSPALVARALTSLHAEVAAREELLNRYGAKDLVSLERERPDAAPPSLLICVDEFAALTAEVPQFVDGMVNIAQRGRSLGMHLILATQRPAGVITANIRANTDLRIALRVASADESTDVLDRRDAAFISRRTPGRAWIKRTGHGTDELVQVAWVGAHASMRTKDAAVEVLPFSANRIDSGPGTAGGAGTHARTDLDRLVATIGEAFIRSGQPPVGRPWLPPLPSDLLFGTAGGELLFGEGALDAEYAPGAAKDVVRAVPAPGQVPIGLIDQPAKRSQPPLALDYPQVGHVLVYGASGSGKTELLRTVAVAATLSSPAPVPYIYAIDFGGGGLLNLAGWPTVGSVVGEHDPGQVLRLLRMLRHTVSERNRTLAAAGAADIGALAAAGRPLARIHLLIDNLPALVEALEGDPVRRQHAERFAAILGDGRRVGVHVTATAPHRTGVPSPMLAAFGERLVLRMPTDDDYGILGARSGVVTADSPPGRGLLGRQEFQVAAPGGAARLVRLAARAGDLSGRPSVDVPAMPSRVPQNALPAPERDHMAIGVEADYVGVVSVRLVHAPLLIAGRARSGRTSLLAGLAALARRSDRPPAEVILAGPRAAESEGRYDRVLTEPEEVLPWLEKWLENLRAAPPDPDGWRMLLVDDVHLWEQSWDAGGPARDAIAGLAGLIHDAPALGIGVVVATDCDEARNRSFTPGVVAAVKRSRMGVLLSPGFSDGGLLSVTVPTHAAESMSGVGRGIFCLNGTTQVIQVLCDSGRKIDSGV